MRESFKNAEGRRVVSGETAEDLGEVKSFVVDPTARHIDAIRVSGRRSSAEFVRWSSITAFGVDAVVTAGDGAVEEASAERETEAVNGKITMSGSRILNTSGLEEDEVRDVIFDTDTGELLAVETSTGQIDASRFRALGSYALIVESD